MNKKNFSTTFVVDQSADKVFDAVTIENRAIEPPIPNGKLQPI